MADYPYQGSPYSGYKDDNKPYTFAGPDADNSIRRAARSALAKPYEEFKGGVQDTLDKTSEAYDKGGIGAAAGQYVRGTIGDAGNALTQGIGKPLMAGVVKPAANAVNGLAGGVGNFGKTLLTGDPTPLFGGDDAENTRLTARLERSSLRDVSPAVNDPSIYRKPPEPSQTLNERLANMSQGQQPATSTAKPNPLAQMPNITSPVMADRVNRMGLDEAMRSPAPNTGYSLMRNDDGKGYTMRETVNGGRLPSVPMAPALDPSKYRSVAGTDKNGAPVYSDGVAALSAINQGISNYNRSLADYDKQKLDQFAKINPLAASPESTQLARAETGLKGVQVEAGRNALDRQRMVDNLVGIAGDSSQGPEMRQEAYNRLQLMGALGDKNEKYITTKEDDIQGGSMERVYRVNGNSMTEVVPTISQADIDRHKLLLQNLSADRRKQHLQSLAVRNPTLFDALQKSSR